MSKPKFFFLLTLLVVCSLSFLSSDAFAWERIISQCSGCGSRAEAVVVDAAGDVIAIGSINGSEVVKMSKADGSVIWRFIAFTDPIQDLAVDSNGDVFVVAAWNRSVVKVSGATGTEMWRGVIGVTIPNAFQPYIHSVTIDHDDNVVTAGTVGGLLNISKLRGIDGTEMWRYEREGVAVDVAIDSGGNVAAAGLMNRNFASVRLSGADGSEIWQREINGAGNFSDNFEIANAVAIDSGGNVVVAGVTSNVLANFRDFTVAKYSPDGTRLWMRIIDGNFSQSNDIANAVVVDRDGDVIAAGSIEDDDPTIEGRREHLQVIKFSGATGDTRWSKSAQEAPFGEEDIYGQAFALSVNAYGNIVAAGYHGNTSPRFTLVKFWGRTGGRAWRNSSSSITGFNSAYDVVMDSNSDVIAAGESVGSDGFPKFTVVKLRRENGVNYDDSPEEEVPEKVIEYAPLVYLYSTDDYRPGSPQTFIDNSSLRWNHEGGCESHLIAPRYTIAANKLGGAIGSEPSPYSANPILPTINGNPCVHNNKITFTTRHYTRPWDKKRAQSGSPLDPFWTNSFYQKEGFYLDLIDDEEIRRGLHEPSGSQIYPDVSVFYEYVEDRYITYWFFYPYDKFAIKGLPDQYHEGDWEGISIQLDCQGDPFDIFYYAHKHGSSWHWTEINWYEGTHPIVYSAKGSHASYPAAGSYPVHPPFDDVTDNGPKWFAWDDLLNVESQPWYGYGGAWGDVNGLIKIGADYTGPLGPGYKNSRMQWSGPPPCSK